MTAKKKAVRDLRRTSKNFPKCRGRIEREGWVAHVLRDRQGIYWDGFTVVDKSDKLLGPASDSERQEMIKLILDGLFGEEVKGALIDDASYWESGMRLSKVPMPAQPNESR